MVAGSLKLQKGWNRLLCKIERCGGAGGYGIRSPKDWGFSVNVVDFDNKPVTDLKYQVEKPDGTVSVYGPPEIGKYYRWEDVKEDYLELLPRLTENDLRTMTGIPELTLVDKVFLMAVPEKAAQKGAKTITLEQIRKGIGEMTHEGKKVTPSNFLDRDFVPFAAFGKGETALDEYRERIQSDKTLNNFLNFDQEGAGALRYVEDGKPWDLIFIRPEYFEEYFSLIDESKSGMQGKTRERILGYCFFPKASYRSTWTGRAVIVAKTYLGEEYPTDELDLLAVPAPPKTGN
jgi:hypothetical protein